MGLICGATEENVIVVTDTGVKNGPLRFDDEFVRHKILDLIGDLALLGRQVIGRIVADRAGHAMHTALVSRLLRDKSLWGKRRQKLKSPRTELRIWPWSPFPGRLHQKLHCGVDEHCAVAQRQSALLQPGIQFLLCVYGQHLKANARPSLRR